MGRFYEITVTPGPTAAVPQPTPFRVWSSVGSNGADNPGALNVIMDLVIYPFAAPAGGSTITIEGPALQDLLQASNFAGMSIAVRGGMSAGFQLADPSQAGLLLEGYVLQSYGNWVGTEQTLDFVLYAAKFTYGNPGNFSFTWKAGTPIKDAIESTLKIAYPNLGRIFRISDNYIWNHDTHHVCGSLWQFAQFVKSNTGGAVEISIAVNNTIVIWDATQAQTPKQLRFTDLIGQPTWIMPELIQFATVMRSDIQVGDKVLMPQGLQDAPGIVQTAAASTPSQLKYKTSFQGLFIVKSVRQLGNFRDPNGRSWSTIFQCAAQT